MSSFKTADQLINELLMLHPKGFDLSLGRISRLLEKLGNPHLKIPSVIHIAGTNGKGSATAFTRAILEAAGYSCHVHTSPHLVNWHERYRIGHKDGGRFVDDQALAECIARVARANNDEPITVFEILTAVAFVLFSENPADATILEVGLGGRFDATNVIENPAATLIMPVSLDHEAYLGSTLKAIAFEKAGIIKPHCPVVISAQDTEALDVLTSVAAKNHAPTHIFGQDFMTDAEHGRMAFQNETGLADLPLPKLVGQFQIANAAAAIEAVWAAGFNIDEPSLSQAMCSVSWPARMQKIYNGYLTTLLPENSELWLDGGHNPAAGQAIVEYLGTRVEKNSHDVILICGMINTKDSRGFLETFKDIAACVYTVPVQTSDAGIAAQVLANIALSIDLKAKVCVSIVAALNEIKQTFSNSKPLLILICGSLYLAGDALKANHTPPV